jgi:hypothetical protein
MSLYLVKRDGSWIATGIAFGSIISIRGKKNLMAILRGDVDNFYVEIIDIRSLTRKTYTYSKSLYTSARLFNCNRRYCLYQLDNIIVRADLVSETQFTNPYTVPFFCDIGYNDMIVCAISGRIDIYSSDFNLLRSLIVNTADIIWVYGQSDRQYAIVSTKCTDNLYYGCVTYVAGVNVHIVDLSTLSIEATFFSCNISCQWGSRIEVDEISTRFCLGRRQNNCCVISNCMDFPTLANLNGTYAVDDNGACSDSLCDASTVADICIHPWGNQSLIVRTSDNTRVGAGVNLVSESMYDAGGYILAVVKDSIGLVRILRIDKSSLGVTILVTLGPYIAEKMAEVPIIG